MLLKSLLITGIILGATVVWSQNHSDTHWSDSHRGDRRSPQQKEEADKNGTSALPGRQENAIRCPRSLLNRQISGLTSVLNYANISPIEMKAVLENMSTSETAFFRGTGLERVTDRQRVCARGLNAADRMWKKWLIWLIEIKEDVPLR